MTNETKAIHKEPVAASKWLFDETMAAYEDYEQHRAKTDTFFMTASGTGPHEAGRTKAAVETR